MTRIDRLTAMLFLIQDHKKTAADLAARFDVSRRTILRDIQGLCEAGFTIVAEPGPGGGFCLPSVSGDALAFSAAEAFLLQLSVQALEKNPRLVDQATWESFAAKVRALIPESLRESVEIMLEDVEVRSPSTRGAVRWHQEILQSLHDAGWIRVDYRSTRGASSQTLQPRRLYLQEGFWYLEAFSRERDEQRTYRVDRIEALELADVPEGGALPAPDTSPRPTYGDPPRSTRGWFGRSLALVVMRR